MCGGNAVLEIDGRGNKRPVKRSQSDSCKVDPVQALIMALDLYERAGLQRTHVSRIEAGKYAVTLETIQAIAEALGMTVDIIDTKLEGLAPLKTLT